MLFLLLNVLSARLCVGGFFGLPFEGNHHGKSYGYGQPGGVNIFFGFSHNRGFWVKIATALGDECFFKVACFEKSASKRWKRTPVFNFVAGNAIKIGVSEFFLKKKVIHDYLRFWFFIYIFLTRNYTIARFLGVFRKACLTWKTLQKWGFRGFEGNRNRALKQGKLMRSKMGCLEAFENGVPMLRGESAPFLNALEDKPQVCFSRANLVRMKRFHRGKTRFFFFLFKWLHLEQKREHFWTLKMKKSAPKLNTTAYIYIYISLSFTHTHLLETKNQTKIFDICVIPISQNSLLAPNPSSMAGPNL